jgi:HK97 gp10 family phage protein
MAGGFGVTYDYARTVEFGTIGMPAEPFFFPTFRLTRKSVRSSMKRKISKTIKQYSAE